MKTALILVGMFFVIVVMSLIDQYFMSKKKIRVKKELLPIFLESKKEQIVGHSLRQELQKKGIRIGYYRFYLLMASLQREGVVTSEDYSDECGPLLLYKLSRLPTLPPQRAESN